MNPGRFPAGSGSAGIALTPPWMEGAVGGGALPPPLLFLAGRSKENPELPVRPSVRPARPRRSLRAPVATGACPGTSRGPGGGMVRAPRGGAAPGPPVIPA